MSMKPIPPRRKVPISTTCLRNMSYLNLECCDVIKLIRHRFPGEDPLYFVSIEEIDEFYQTSTCGSWWICWKRYTKHANITIEREQLQRLCPLCQKSPIRLTVRGRPLASRETHQSLNQLFIHTTRQQNTIPTAPTCFSMQQLVWFYLTIFGRNVAIATL